MSDSVTSSGERSEKRSRAGESVLPQWAIDLLRPVIWLMGRIFWNLKLSGLENIPTSDGLIVASNHQSYIDPFLISVPIKRPLRFLAWDVPFGWPFVGKAMQLLGAWPLQLERSDPAAIRRSLQWLRDGQTLMIFPEGGRSQADGSLETFKAGAVRIALEARVPILPVTIRGANHVWPSGRRIPRLGRIEIIYHPVYRPQPQNGEDNRACARRESERLAEIIGSALPSERS